MAEADARSKLREHFTDKPFDQHAQGWDDLWKKSFTPWDRNAPSPALIDTLNNKQKVLGSPFKDSSHGERKKAFVPGCGKGYDVLLFASYGYDAYGLDVSKEAVEKAAKMREDPKMAEKYPLAKGVESYGESKIMLEDFFSDYFLSQTGGRSFDVIYDYTFLCALPPEMRPKWAKRMAELLAPNGHLVCLEFPLGKEPSTGGPPHGLQRELYEQLLAHPGREVEYDENGCAVEDRSSDEPDNALVRVDRWLAERTHSIGQGKDHVSVWMHK